MDEWVVWLIAAVVLGAGEVLTTGFFLAPFALGALVAALADTSSSAGAVKLEGEVWTARPYDEDAVIPAGARVHVLEIKGATALVSE
jgi:membrane protein implicated in regulation of membrane protease activity